MIGNSITGVIDFFYPPFRRLMPLHTFRYAACGAGNLFLDLALYYVFYNYVLRKEVLDLGFIAFKPHIAAFFLSFLITFPIGFLLSRYVVWVDSVVLWHVQLFRYFLIVVINLFLNYILLKLFVEYFHIYPTVSRLLIAVIVIIFSYLSQKHFTFGVRRKRAVDNDLL